MFGVEGGMIRKGLCKKGIFKLREDNALGCGRRQEKMVAGQEHAQQIRSTEGLQVLPKR